MEALGKITEKLVEMKELVECENLNHHVGTLAVGFIGHMVRA